MPQPGDLHRRTILVADDESSMRDLLSLLLEAEGYRVITASNGREALDVFRRHREEVDLVFQDLKMPEMDGHALLRHFKEEAPDVPVVIITAFSSWDSAVEGMRLGAHDYIRKPFDTDAIRLVVSRVFERQNLIEAASPALRAEISSQGDMVGNHPRIQEVLRLVRQVAPTDSTVLIQGESGTGKELVARAVHYRSLRKSKAFISVNCSAFAESLLESELFGHVRGAFTGAVQDKDGFFRAADGGTLFLDEVADMSLTTQVKILRALEEKRVTPVGSTSSHGVDVRIIAATNKDIEQAVREGQFREDLFYRLNVIPIHLPALRERKEDIPLLTGHFLARYSRQMGKSVTSLSDAAQDALYRYDWPGNVRELDNMIQRHVALCEGPVIEDVRLTSRSSVAPEPVDGSEEGQRIPACGIDLEDALESVERSYIREALEMTGGNLTSAAKLLGTSYRSIRYRVKKLKLKETEAI